jgi:hypothetical protein
MGDDDLIALGYLLVRPHADFAWANGLLPNPIISVSTCLCPQFPGSYAIEWCTDSEESRARAFEAVGIPPDRRQTARQWATKAFNSEFGWETPFYSIEAARTARRDFFPPSSEVQLIGLALPREHRAAFLAATKPPDPTEGYAPVGASGHFTMAERNLPVAPGGQILGFEPLNIEGGQIDHSWLCNDLHTHYAQALGIKPNAAGFIATAPEAQRCCDDINTGAIGAEPGPWFPFALISFERGVAA